MIVLCFLLLLICFFSLESGQFHFQLLILLLQSLDLVFVASLVASVKAMALSSSSAIATIYPVLWMTFLDLQNSTAMFRKFVAEPPVTVRVRTAK